MKTAVEFKEIGVEGLKNFRSKIEVGDLVCNHWAGQDNPNRIGIFIGYRTFSGLKCIELTDKKATKRWHPIFDKKCKLEIIKQQEQ
jgi:hypothetical protein